MRKTESFFSAALKDALFLTEYPGLSCDLCRMTFVPMVCCQPWLRHYKKAVIFTKAGVRGNNIKILFIVNT